MRMKVLFFLLLHFCFSAADGTASAYAGMKGVWLTEENHGCKTLVQFQVKNYLAYSWDCIGGKGITAGLFSLVDGSTAQSGVMLIEYALVTPGNPLNFAMAKYTITGNSMQLTELSDPPLFDISWTKHGNFASSDGVWDGHTHRAVGEEISVRVQVESGLFMSNIWAQSGGPFFAVYGALLPHTSPNGGNVEIVYVRFPGTMQNLNWTEGTPKVNAIYAGSNNGLNVSSTVQGDDSAFYSVLDEKRTPDLFDGVWTGAEETGCKIIAEFHLGLFRSWVTNAGNTNLCERQAFFGAYTMPADNQLEVSYGIATVSELEGTSISMNYTLYDDNNKLNLSFTLGGSTIQQQYVRVAQPPDFILVKVMLDITSGDWETNEANFLKDLADLLGILPADVLVTHVNESASSKRTGSSAILSMSILTDQTSGTSANTAVNRLRGLSRDAIGGISIAGVEVVSFFSDLTNDVAQRTIPVTLAVTLASLVIAMVVF